MSIGERRAIHAECGGSRWSIGRGRSNSPGVNPILLDETAVRQRPMRHRERRLTGISFGDLAHTGQEHPRSVDEPTTHTGHNVAELREPLGHIETPSAAHAAVPFGVVVDKPCPTKPSKQLRSAYSFIGGSLIGISICLPVFALDAGKGGGAPVLLGCLTLAATGIGIHLRGAKQPNTSRKGLVVAAKSSASTPRTPNSS